MIRRHPHSQAGFTLIEVLVALAILAAGIIGLAQAWSGNFMRMRKTALFNDVSTLLERKMIEIDAKYKPKQLSEIPDEEEGDFGSEHPQYRWTLKSKDLKLPDLTPLLVGQDDGADEMLLSMVKQVSEFLNKAVKEVRVTVFVKRGAKETSFAASEYFVDYSKDFAGGGLGAAPGGQPQNGAAGGIPGGNATGGQAPGGGGTQ